MAENTDPDVNGASCFLNRIFRFPSLILFILSKNHRLQAKIFYF